MAMMLWQSVLVFILFGLSNAKEKRKSLNMDPINVSEWGLPVDREYPTIVELTDDNFDDVVLKSEDAWIVIFYEGTLHSKWDYYANRLKGVVWYGAVNSKNGQKVIEDWIPDLTEKQLSKQVSLIFPFHKRSKKGLKLPGSKWPKISSKPKKAEEIAAKSMPNNLEVMDFSPNGIESFHQWIVQIYYKSDPPKFPVLCLTDEESPTIPTIFLALSHYFNDFFAFGLVRKSGIGAMQTRFKQVPEPQEYPHYLTLLGREPAKIEWDAGKKGLHFNVFPFNDKKYGPAHQMQSLIKYLFTVNEDYREILPGRHADEQSSVSSLTSLRTSLRERVELLSNESKSKRKAKTEL